MKKNYILLISLVVFVNSSLFATKLKKEQVVSDRQYWADLLYKISYPVVHNLADGTLKKTCHWN